MPLESDRADRVLAGLVLVGACVMLASTAFDLIEPIVKVGPLSFTNAELAAGVFFITVILWAASERADFFSRRSLDLAVALYIATNVISSIFADDRAGALKFSFRLTFAALVYVGISRLPGYGRKSQVVVGGALTATLVALTAVGLLETFVFNRYFLTPFAPFQEGVISFGSFYNVRTSATMPFPTVLSSYLGLVYPVALATAIWVFIRWKDNRWRNVILGGAVIVTIAVMVIQIYTFTRSGLVAMLVSLAAGAAAAHGFGMGTVVTRFFAMGAVLLALSIGVLALASNQVGTRFGIAEQENRYSAVYEIVEFPDELIAGGKNMARVRVINDSEFTWKPDGRQRVFLAYRWIKYPEMESANVEFIATLLPFDVGGGEELEIDMEFFAPEKDGTYVLVVEMFKTYVSWFSASGTPSLNIPVEFEGSVGRRIEVDGLPQVLSVAEPALESVPRSALWKAAINMWRDHPVIGVGSDQYRRQYGEYVPGYRHDDRLRTHNIFLESLANTGVLGLTALLFLLAMAARDQWGLIRNRSLGIDMRAYGLAALVALIAFVLHGMLDYFLWQTGVVFIFFALLGLTSWLSKEALTGDTGR